MNSKNSLLSVSMLILVLSMVVATQYATTKVGYSYAIVHPSNADIRFIGSDNSSADGLRVLRVSGSNGTNAQVGLELGNWSATMNNTYTAAFAIVNEEPFAINITYISVTNTSGTNDYMQVWLHGNGSLKAEDDPTSVFLYNNGTAYYTASSTVWQMAKGDGDVSTMHPDISDGATMITTGWDKSAHVRYTTNLSGENDDAFQVGASGRTLNNASDFVWVQISINVPAGAVDSNHAGTIEVHFQASSHLQSAATGGGGEPQLYEYCNINDDDAAAVFDDWWVAQTFTIGTVGPNENHDITSVKLKLWRTGSPGTVTVSIRATDGSGKPTGGDLTSGTTNGDTLTTDIPGEWREIALTSYELTAGTKYAIVVRCAGLDPGNMLAWRMDFVSTTYAGGSYGLSMDGGSTWTLTATRDQMFEEWGNVS